MRIRKRSITVLSSSSCKQASSFSCTDYCHGESDKEKEFLLPLVAAVMDVQAKAEAEVEGAGNPTPQPTAAGGVPEAHTRHSHNWRNALLRCNSESEGAQVDRKHEKSNYSWNCITSGNPEDKFGPFTSQCKGKIQGDLVKEGPSSSVGQEISGFNRELRFPKLNRFERSVVSRKQDLGVGSFKKERMKQDRAIKCHEIRHIIAGRKDGAMISGNDSLQNDKPEKKGKTARDNDNNKNNEHAGSQCRRRNGRGWRCSERTLVGYSLCEHHLGKGRLKSINDSSGADHAVNSKGSKFKELHLIQAVSCKN